MRSFTSFAVAALLAAGVAQVAQADVTTPWGFLTPNHPKVALGNVDSGSFTDTYTFSLGQEYTLGTSAVVLDLEGAYDITDAYVSLYAVADPTTALLTYDFDTASGAATYFKKLTSGAYFFEVKGIGGDDNGGNYLFDVKVSPVLGVPEPETYALMGLGLVALVAARRKKMGSRD